jgi:hypothetical protein
MLSAPRHKSGTIARATYRWFHGTIRATNKVGGYVHPPPHLIGVWCPTWPLQLQLHAVHKTLNHRDARLRLAHVSGQPLSAAERQMTTTFANLCT